MMIRLDSKSCQEEEEEKSEEEMKNTKRDDSSSSLLDQSQSRGSRLQSLNMKKRAVMLMDVASDVSPFINKQFMSCLQFLPYKLKKEPVYLIL